MSITDKFEQIKALAGLRDEIVSEIERAFTVTLNRREVAPQAVDVDLTTGEVNITLHSSTAGWPWIASCLKTLGVHPDKLIIQAELDMDDSVDLTLTFNLAIKEPPVKPKK